MPAPNSNPTPAPYQPYQHLLIKFLDCIFVAIAVVDFYDSLILFPATFLLNGRTIIRILNLINAILAIATIAFAIIYPLRWRHQETRATPAGDHATPNSPLRHAWLTGIIRYWLAAVILNYGFAKIFGTQFAPSYFKADTTWAGLSGYDLTWNYFSHSYAMSTIIAAIQITGCIFLFFRRTTMPGILLLLPVMINVSLIDIFYDIAGGATANAVLFTLALIYLLSLQWPAIRDFIRRSQPSLPSIRPRMIRNLLRLAFTVWAFAFIAWVAGTRRPASLTGKWRVDQLSRNGRIAQPNDWLTDSLSWKYIYLEEFGRATLSPNPYVVERGRATIGVYTYDAAGHFIRFTFFHQPSNDTASAQLTTTTPGHMHWTLIDHPDTISLTLTRVAPL